MDAIAVWMPCPNLCRRHCLHLALQVLWRLVSFAEPQLTLSLVDVRVGEWWLVVSLWPPVGAQAMAMPKYSSCVRIYACVAKAYCMRNCNKRILYIYKNSTPCKIHASFITSLCKPACIIARGHVYYRHGSTIYSPALTPAYVGTLLLLLWQPHTIVHGAYAWNLKRSCDV